MKVARCHQWIAWFYAAVAFLATITITDGWILGVFVLPFVLLHGAIALGAKRKARWAWLLSQLVAILFFPLLPIGTFIAVYLVGNNEWDEQPIASEEA